MFDASPQQPLDPVAMPREEGEARWWLGCLAVTKLAAADTGGAMSIVEITEPPGAEAPRHVHHLEDETFWILDGSVTFEVGGTTFEAGPGDLAFGPRDVPHSYKVGPQGCRMLFILTPGGFERAIEAMSTPARTRTLPPDTEAPPDMTGLESQIAAFGCEMVEDEGAGHV
ncbi:cupin domain-containing protein [Paraconexibacter sp.]|uniref:cupin domain-containing protein n=1 Tax=Paraconexibacter sp. TaxID=2949640 RepID=UPI003567306B